MNMNVRYILLSLIVTLLLTACRQDVMVVEPMTADTGDEELVQIDYTGMYVLNEGNMGSNKATLDFLDLTTGKYHRNIYPSRNPNTVMELGDVGNDVKIYGSSLWLSINCSNKVEVADAATAVSRGHVDIPNCRFIAFHGPYAYVSSYVGPVGGTSVEGSVYQVDTLSLNIVNQVTVGFQPDELAVADGKLYVANSGGYNATQGKGYDRTVSVIDLQTFRVVKTIDVAPNLFRLRVDRKGQLWVSSRGDYAGTPARLFWLKDDAVGGSLELSVGDMAFRGDSLCYYSSTQDGATSMSTFGVIDINTHTIVSERLIRQTADHPIQTAYGLMVHPVTGDVYVMDATNYVSSGKLFCFDKDGQYKWETWTGDIPGHAAFLNKKPATDDDYKPEIDPDKTYSPYIQAVDEYVPAPGQFVNTLPVCDESDTPASVAEKCTEVLANNAGGMITLGGYGGYVTFHFDHPIVNVSGEYDLYIAGNAYQGNSEPGVVMVSKDINHNGKPDDPWYELSGSADVDSIGKVVYGYEITYTKSPMQDTPWTDNQGGSGVISRNDFHQQEYFPLWLGNELTFRGTLLPKNGVNEGKGNSQNWQLSSFRYGYVDNYANSNKEGCSFNIDWAVDARRQPVQLDYIDFVRVYNGENQLCGWLGETSTEVTGAEDLHLEQSLNTFK